MELNNDVIGHIEKGEITAHLKPKIITGEPPTVETVSWKVNDVLLVRRKHYEYLKNTLKVYGECGEWLNHKPKCDPNTPDHCSCGLNAYIQRLNSFDR